MVDPIRLTRQQEVSPEALVSTARSDYQLTERLANLAERLRHLDGILERVDAAHGQHPQDSALVDLAQEIGDRVFDLRNTEGLLDRIEERLGQGDSEPVDLTLQQTLEVVQQLRRLSETVPNDERLATVATNVCEGLESFVSDVLSEGQSTGDGATPGIGPSPGDLTMALEVISAIQTCPGADRTATYKALRQQFIDGACRSAWSRVDLLFDTQLDRASRREYLHEALTIWTLLPDLSENAGSPRLSQLPEDIGRTVQQVLLREVVGATDVGDPRKLLQAALLAKELGDDYLTMVPAISVDEAQTELGRRAGESMFRRIGTEISRAGSSEALEQCLSVLSVLRTVPGLAEDERLGKMSGRVARARWRIRLAGAASAISRMALPLFLVLVGVMGLIGGYIGLAALIENLYGVSLPLGP